MNASIASVATRQRPPTRRAGSRPLAIQRWTDRVVVPIRAAAWLGLSSSDIDVAIVAYPARDAGSAAIPTRRDSSVELAGIGASREPASGIRVGAQAGRRFSLNARKPSWASSLVRCRAMTRAVCHFAEPWPSPRTSRTIALAARAAVGPAASRSATAASTAASSASSPSTISWTSPIRAARVASNRRPPGKSARAWLSPILAITNGLMTEGRIPSRVSVNPKRVPDSAMTRSETAHRPIPPPSAEPVDPGDDRHRAGVDGLEHVGHRHRVLLVALGVEGHRRAHPGEVGAGTERRSVAGQDDRPELGRALAGEHREGRPQLGDERRIERVVDLRPGQRHSGDDVTRPGPLDAQSCADEGAHGRIVRQRPAGWSASPLLGSRSCVRTIAGHAGRG